MNRNELAELKRDLIADWSRSAPQPAPPGPRLQAVVARPRSRAGLAIGHSSTADGGAPCLELRVTASAGPNFAMAQSLAKRAQERGLRVNMQSVGRLTSPRLESLGPDDGGPIASLADRTRPPFVGQSVGHHSGGAGTLGLFVRTPEGENGLLSCAHVLALPPVGAAAVGDDVHQPGPLDQDPFLPVNTVGQLTKYFAPLVKRQSRNVDAAIARLGVDCVGPLRNAFPDCGEIPPAYRGRAFGALLPVDEIEPGDETIKFGRSTGFTDNAVVNAIEFENLGVWFSDTENFIYSNAIELLWSGHERFTREGDSGALVVRRRDLRPIGLHFAADEQGKLSYVMPLERIRDIWKLEVI